MKKYFRFVLLFLCIVLFLTSCATSNGKKGQIIAKVNNKEITLDEYEKNIILFGGQYEVVFGQDIWNQEIGKGITYRESFKKEVFDRMITQELILQAAEEMNIKISNAEIENEVIFFKEKNKNNTDFQNNLVENSIGDEFLREQFKYDLYLEKYKVKIIENEKIDQAAIKRYYETNITKFTNDEVKASHILFKTVDDNLKTLSDSKIENKLVLAESVLNKLENGAEFEDMALKYSEDIATAGKGGDLGYFKEGEMAHEFDEEAFKLKPGEISKIVKTIHGYHIIKVYDKIQEKTPLEEVKDGIVAKLQMEAFDKKIKELHDAAQIKEYRDVVEKTGEKHD